MSERDKQSEHDRHEPDDEQRKADLPEHMKPENLKKLRDYGKDSIPPGVY
ncbi:hypothetical protein N8H22_07670 [Stutzerimonas stutzeri]|nr:hypothetical protein [Stutzerimonas sp. S1]MCW3148477.1 hypothetical protein [Stutzerimonas sp. S1]